MCSNLLCQWKGPLESIIGHFAKCQYNTADKPKWYRDYVESQEVEFQKNQLRNALEEDDEIADQLN